MAAARWTAKKEASCDQAQRTYCLLAFRPATPISSPPGGRRRVAPLTSSVEPTIAERGSHIEVKIDLPCLRGADFLDILTRATDRFGQKPVLVLCDDLRREMSLDDAYRIGVEVATRFPVQKIAIVVRGRDISDAEHFTELVAANRGASVRWFQHASAARSWLGI